MEAKSSNITRALLWIAMAVAPLVSMFLVGLVSGTSVFSIDAWNTEWNDERHYFWTVQQMHLFGEPQGVAGYNEVTAARPSYGPYSVVTYVPYYLGAFFTGTGSHNYVYAINVALSVIAAGVVILVLRPDVRRAAFCAVFFLTQFIIERYACSGMTEESYVLFAAIVGSCAVWIGVHGSAPSARWKLVLAFVASIAAIGFWGAMRPFLLAFAIVPCALLVWGRIDLTRPARVVLFVFALVASAIALVSYVYVAKYYATPYFGDSSTLDLLANLINGGIPEFVRLHGRFVLSVGKSFVTLNWAGILTFLFVVAWVILLVLAIRMRNAEKGRQVMPRCKHAAVASDFVSTRSAFVVAVSLLVAGALMFEANILLYSAARIHRMLIAVDVVYFIAIVWFGACAVRQSAVTWRLGYQVLVTVLCAASLLVNPGSFAYPQASDSFDAATEKQAAEALAAAMPQQADAWDNTVAHPVESNGLQIYYCLPAYLNLNGCTKEYVKQAMKDGSLSSKYLSLPAKSSLNKKARKQYDVVYEGLNHVIYKVK